MIRQTQSPALLGEAFAFGKVWLFGYNATIFRETLRYIVNLCSIASKSLHEKGKSWHESRKSWHECRFGFARIGADCRFLLACRDGIILTGEIFKTIIQFFIPAVKQLTSGLFICAGIECRMEPKNISKDSCAGDDRRIWKR